MSERPLIDVDHEQIIALAEETQFAPNGIVSRTILRTPGMRAVLFGFSEGQELTEHTSTQHAVVQILTGECEFSLAGKPHHLKTGDLLYMPPNLAHAVKATEKFSMLLILSKHLELEETKPMKSSGRIDLNSSLLPPADSFKMKTTTPTAPIIDKDKVMDVRPIPCSVKHGLILKTWQELPLGDHFILLNDHDPVPCGINSRPSSVTPSHGITFSAGRMNFASRFPR